MMCLAHCKINMKIELENGKPSVLVIENPVVMRELLLELEEQLQGLSGGYTLSIDCEPIPIGKNLVLIKDLINIDCNEKKILTRLYQSIIDEEKMQYSPQRENFDKAYLAYLKELCLLSKLPLSYNERLGVGELLKSAHVTIDHAESSYIEIIWYYIKILGDLLHVKVFVFVNLKSFISNDELDLLYAQCLYEQRLLLLIESHETPFRADEKKIIIDSDKCMIYY